MHFRKLYFLLNNGSLYFYWICMCIFFKLVSLPPTPSLPYWSCFPLLLLLLSPPHSTLQLSTSAFFSRLSAHILYTSASIIRRSFLSVWFQHPSKPFWTYLPFLWDKGFFGFLESNRETFFKKSVIILTLWCYQKGMWYLESNVIELWHLKYDI